MVALFNHCTFNLNPRAASIDTPLHGFVPHAHVDHVHADAVIAIAASENAEALTQEVVRRRDSAFCPGSGPGFDLGLKLGAMAEANPKLKASCSAAMACSPGGRPRRTATRRRSRSSTRPPPGSPPTRAAPAFGGEAIAGSAAGAQAGDRRAAHARDPQAHLGGRAQDRPFHRRAGSAGVRQFARSSSRWRALGTSCPDHFLRTKIRPLVLPFDPAATNLDAVVASLDDGLAAYRADYAAYYERCKRPNSPAMRDPNAVIYLVPGVGMLSFAKDKATARIAAEFYVNAINVMRGASGVSRYVGLAEQEAFDIEYWLLEEAKLQRMPKPKSLAGRVAFITGGAGGIGRAIAAALPERRRLRRARRHRRGEPRRRPSPSSARRSARTPSPASVADVTDETAVEAAFDDAVVAYGGVDIVVANAGIASAAPFEDTSLELWNRNMAILATGYFLVGREEATAS